MNKLILGVVAVGAAFALRPVAKRRIVPKMREHCTQMAGTCKQMMAGESADRGPVAGMREHCSEMMAARKGQGEAAETGGHSEQDASRVVGSGEPVEG